MHDADEFAEDSGVGRGNDVSTAEADVDNASRLVDRAFDAWQRRRKPEDPAGEWLPDSILEEDLLDAIIQGQSD